MKILEKTTEEIAMERARWLDAVIRSNIPEWKIRVLLKWNNLLLRKLLRADIKTINETLIADFGTRVVVLLNGKQIAERKYNL